MSGRTHRWAAVVAVAAVAAVAGDAPGRARVAFLPFDDRVKLKEVPWELSVDIPGWFSRTVDTIGARDSLLQCVAFDSVRALIRDNRWARRDWSGPLAMQTIASRFDAACLVTGTVERFKLIKRALNGNGSLGGTHEASKYATGGGEAPVTVGLQSYTAHVRLTVAIYDGRTGNLVQTMPLDVDEKDGGLKVWLPMSGENDELNFYYAGVNPFGSEYFMKTIAGAVMKRCSQLLRETLVARASAVPAPRSAGREFMEGRVLDVSGSDVYVNLGSADNLFLGQVLEVLKPERPVLGPEGDTLGWVETRVATLTVRSIKSSHFAQATMAEPQVALEAGWTVRSVLEQAPRP